MLAPIVTKDMKLFPSQRIPAHVKNVRSRAQSLQDVAEANARRQHQQRVAQATKQRNSRSTGNLNAALTPKGSLVAKRQPLDSIAEGVEISNTSSAATLTTSAMNSSASSASASTINTPTSDLNGNRDNGQLIRVPAIDLVAVKKSPVELCSLQELSTRPTSALSTTSEPVTSPPTDASKPKTLTHGIRKFFNNTFKSQSKTNNNSRCHQQAVDSRSKRQSQIKPSASTSPSTVS